MRFPCPRNRVAPKLGTNISILPRMTFSSEIRVGIVTYNSATHIEACLRSLAVQTSPPVAIHIFDNASQDSTLAVVQNLLTQIPGLPPLTVTASPQNLGFGSAHNQILAQTSEPWYLLMNPDAVLAPDFLAQALQVVQAPPDQLHTKPWGGINGAICYSEGSSPSPIIYSLGHVLFRDRRMEDLGIGEVAATFAQQSRALFGSNGACPLLSVLALRDVSYPEGPFDSAYFLYGEDDDLNWRMALAGYATWFVPQCQAFHDAGSSGGFSSARARHNALANRWLTLVKNENALLFLRDLPLILFFEFLYYALRLVRRPAFACDLFGALQRFVHLLPHALRRRRITPVRISRKQESALFEAAMGTRLATLFARYRGKKSMKSLWTRAEAKTPS